MLKEMPQMKQSCCKNRYQHIVITVRVLVLSLTQRYKFTRALFCGNLAVAGLGLVHVLAPAQKLKHVG